MNQEIIELYTLYGFSLFESTEEYMVFTHGNGYFNNAEIVTLTDSNTKDIQEQLELLGFSVRTIHFESISNIHDRLFMGFFSANNTKQKIAAEYKRYSELQQKKLICDHYEYLNCDYITQDYDSHKDITSFIMDKLSAGPAQLIILEAAAGYGKTCTSFEVLKRFADKSVYQIPLMTELSRNRKASIFRYVLLSEIDTQFSNLNQKVVEYEICNGNVPLIIDGFDELLSKSIDENTGVNDAFDETQGMLDTIANLFQGDSKCKILITSRKSAIFTGEKFDEWIEKHDLGGKITRIELKAPQIRGWLSAEKIEILNNKGINLAFLSNPILLSILKNQDEDAIREKSVNEIIENYIKSVFDREKERQSLTLSVEEQVDVLSKVAQYFAELNISAEEDGFVKEILQEATKDNIDEFIARYSRYQFYGSEEVPDTDEFLMKLLHNAFLDRPIPGKNLIGFINDFSFGYFLGLAVLKGYLNLTTKQKVEYKYIDLMCTSFMLDEMQEKKTLSECVKNILGEYSVNQQLEICNKLYHKAICEYENETICDVTFTSGFVFSGDACFKNTTFVNCVFDNCVFQCDAFLEVKFYNCIFYSPDFSGISCGNNTLLFFSCSGHEELAKKYAFEIAVSSQNENYEQIVLEQFWKRGSDSPEPRRAFTTIRKGVDPKKLSYIDEALASLISRGIIIKRSVCYELVFSKLSEIREILGRM